MLLFHAAVVFLAVVSLSAGFIFGPQKEDCAKQEKVERCVKAFDSKEKCLHPANRRQMMECMVTCGTCDSFACQNPQPESVINCTSLVEYCEDRVFEPFLKEKCPFTCGKCMEKQGSLCEDNAPRMLCQTVEKYCNSVEFYDLMTAQCASTCNRCPDNGTTTVGGTGGGQCRDRARDCSSNLALCNEPAYSGMMARACARSCNKCNACEDATLLCPFWVHRGFCSNYAPEIRKSYCSRSCGMCTASSQIATIPTNPLAQEGHVFGNLTTRAVHTGLELSPLETARKD